MACSYIRPEVDLDPRWLQRLQVIHLRLIHENCVVRDAVEACSSPGRCFFWSALRAVRMQKHWWFVHLGHAQKVHGPEAHVWHADSAGLDLCTGPS